MDLKDIEEIKSHLLDQLKYGLDNAPLEIDSSIRIFLQMQSTATSLGIAAITAYSKSLRATRKDSDKESLAFLVYFSEKVRDLIKEKFEKVITELEQEIELSKKEIENVQ